MKHIKKIGVELEGGWVSPELIRRLIRANNVNVGSDGSIRGVDGNAYEITPVTPFADIEKLKEWTLNYYPESVDRSCGLHVHVSFKNNLYYQQCMDKPFHSYIKTEMLAWGKKNKITNPEYEKRLTGQNTFCADKHDPVRQWSATNKSSARYTMINYCYTQHGTLEFRFLPMMKKKEWAYRAVRYLIGLTERWFNSITENPIDVKVTGREVEIASGVAKVEIQDTVHYGTTVLNI